jgi:hypothetical protein
MLLPYISFYIFNTIIFKDIKVWSFKFFKNVKLQRSLVPMFQMNFPQILRGPRSVGTTSAVIWKEHCAQMKETSLQKNSSSAVSILQYYSKSILNICFWPSLILMVLKMRNRNVVWLQCHVHSNPTTFSFV